MNFAINPLSVIPVRRSASDKSEMISQILFGEMVEVLETRGAWARIRCSWDNYIGWVDSKQMKSITQDEFHLYRLNHACSIELVQPAAGNGYYLPITIGANLPNFDGLRFSLNGSSFQFSGQAITPSDIEPSAEMLLKMARRYLYAPYVWGGRSPFGIDCSGLTQVLYKLIGISIPRDSSDQVEEGQLVDFIEQAQEGDLAFFENRKGQISHVGIIMPDNQIIHASGQVRIDKIDHYGIYNVDTKKYSHRLRVIKRILPTMDISISIAEQEMIDKNQVPLFK
jgi:gamma-D-glutamyl-L-lysine dipeptidyl-peptidase